MSEKNEFELKRLDHIHQERIKYIEFNNQYTLIQHETHCECFRDSIKYSVELSKTALNGALILNGTGIIPIVYSKVEFLYPAAVHFAWGALWAVCSALVGYLYQSLIIRTWRYYVFKAPGTSSQEACAEELEHPVSQKKMEYLLYAAIVLGFLSLLQFGRGVYSTTEYLDKVNSKPIVLVQPASKSEEVTPTISPASSR